MRFSNQTSVLIPLLAVLMLGSGCGMAGAPPVTEASASAANQAIPFGSPAGAGKMNARASETVAIPAGTPLTVRLQTGVSSATARAGDSFQAVLDQPLVVSGRTVAPSGVAVTGAWWPRAPRGDCRIPDICGWR